MWLYYCLTLYILLLGLFFGFGKQHEYKNRMYIYLTFGVFLFLSALRGKSVGNDTSVYLSVFKNISLSGDIADYTGRFELGYLYLNKMLSMITNQQQIIIIVTSSIIMIGFARFIFKYSKIPWLSVFLFFTLGYYGMSMNTIRLNIAIVFILYSYDFLREKKSVKFLLSVLLGALFHRTAIVFLLAWFITKLKFNIKTIGIAIFTSVLLFSGFHRILGILFKIFPTYNYFLDSIYLDGNTRIASVMNLLVGLSIVLFGVFTKYYKDPSKENITINKKIMESAAYNDGQYMLLLILVGVSVTLISFNFSLLDRVADFFLVFSCVYLPNSIKNISNYKLRVLICFIVIILFFSYSTAIILLRPEWNVIYPYYFYWLP